MSTGGIFIGGSIATKNLPKMQEPIFMQSFLDKGRMAELLKDMPVKIVLKRRCRYYGGGALHVDPKGLRPHQPQRRLTIGRRPSYKLARAQ